MPYAAAFGRHAARRGARRLLLAALLGLLIAAVTTTRFLPTDWLPLVPWLKLAGVVALTAVVLTPPFRGTATRWIGAATGVFLAATTLASGLAAAGTRVPDVVRDFPATPIQVLLLLVAAAIVLAVWNLAAPRRRVARRNDSRATRCGCVPWRRN